MDVLNTWLQDSTSWVLITFIVFCAIAWKMGRKSAVASLDGYITKVKDRIEQAEILRAEAANLARDYEQKHANALATAQGIIDEARVEAKEIIERGDADIKSRLNVRQKQFNDELLRFEEQALVELKTHMARLIEDYARQRLVAELSGDVQNTLIERAIETARDAKKQAA